jgi:hypothetical protein
MNKHWVVGVWQKETHSAEPLLPEPIALEFEMVTENLKRHKSSGIDLIPAEFITERGRRIHSYL